MNDIGHEQPTRRVLQADQGLGREHLTGADVELRQVMQHQGVVVAGDGLFQVQFDVVADRVISATSSGCTRATVLPLELLAAACALHRPDADDPNAVAPGLADGDADTDSAGEQFAVDHHLLVAVAPAIVRANASAASISMASVGTTMNSSPPKRAMRRGHVDGIAQQLDEGLDESVTSVVTEVVVDHFEAVQIEE